MRRTRNDAPAGAIRYVFETPLGWIGISATHKGLSRLTLPVTSFREAGELIGSKATCGQSPPDILAGTVGRIRKYLDGYQIEFTDAIDLAAVTEFRRTVLEITRSIPYGETRSYSWVAGQTGRPQAFRAAGQALGANPLPIIIPCHRVLAKDGSPGGYAGGTGLKRYLLRLEAT